MAKRFQGKFALVTGAGSGIGREIALALQSEGAVVYALDKDQRLLDALKEDNDDIHTVCADLRDWTASTQAIQSLGRIDLLVNNAAICTPRPFLEEDEHHFHEIINSNLKHIVSVSQVVAKGMKDRQSGGAIVNMSSQQANNVLPGFSSYASTKAAILSITKSMALELAPYKIRTNALTPTLVRTPMVADFVNDDNFTKTFLTRMPAGRVAETTDIVGPVLFLLSEESGMVNGTALSVDGGFTVC